ncbi:hypothetical protein [Microbispora rosea]|uniref:hypothetical protein n=1 Tax=Microbispora rosea TaxID=58117 RepID=UPI00378A1C24
MCETCWDERGRPADWNTDVERAVALIRRICEEERTGGPLHSVISNWNITGVIEPWESPDFSPETMEAARELADLFNEMEVEERAAALAYHDRLTPKPAKTCGDCERCTWNPGPDCGRPEHERCSDCGHCEGRHNRADGDSPVDPAPARFAG